MSLVQAAEAPLSAVVFTKAIDPEPKYPLRTEQLLHAVREKLGRFSSHDLQSVLFKEGWKEGWQKGTHLRKTQAKKEPGKKNR